MNKIDDDIMAIFSLFERLNRRETMSINSMALDELYSKLLSIPDRDVHGI